MRWCLPTTSSSEKHKEFWQKLGIEMGTIQTTSTIEFALQAAIRQTERS